MPVNKIVITSKNKEILDGIARKVLNNLKFKNKMSKATKLAALAIQEFIAERLEESDTFKSLTGDDGIGELRGEFGLDDSSVDQIRSEVYSFIGIAFSGFSDIIVEIGGKGGLYMASAITLGTDPEINSFTFSSDKFSFKTEKGDDIVWLDWLLNAGTSTVISEYRYKRREGSGRSKLGVMLESKSGYSVNPKFAGTSEDNWLTRIIFNNKEQMKAIIIKFIKENLK